MHRIRLASVLISVFPLAWIAFPAAAEVVVNDRETLRFDRPVAWAMAWTAAVTYPSALAEAKPLAPGELEASLEGSWVPSLSPEQRTVGLLGDRPEDLNRTSVVGRPQVTLGLPASFSLTVAWMPPLELDGVKPNLVSASIGRPLWQGARGGVAARLIGERGTIRGDMTCPAHVARSADPNVNPYGCETPSDDEMSLRLVGLELAASRSLERWPSVSPYATLGASRLHAEFQVNARRGFLDRSRLETDGTLWTASAGLSIAASGRARLAGEVFYAPLSVDGRAGKGRQSDGLVNARVLLAYRIR